MAYIGKTPVLGNFVKLDAITVVNGQAAYTMQNGGVNFTSYDNVNQFLVSLNGILQSPTDSFTVSGSTLTFASNLSTGDVIDFVMVLGNTLDVGTPSDNTVTTAKLADSSVTAAKITDATITAAKLASGTVQNQSAFKNIIINGDMIISQRGTSFTGLGDTDSQYTLDRFKWVEEGATDTAEYTVSQSTDVPTGQGFAKSLKVDCTTADTSIDANNIQYIGTAIEGQNLQYLKYGTSNAESTTLSFWVKSNKTGTYGVALLGNDSPETQYSQTYTISSADTWEKKTLSFVGDTSNGFDNDNGSSLLIQWYLVAGTNKTSGSSQTWGTTTQANRAAGQTVNLADSTANEWYITGVQLEAGTSASDFEFLPYDVNLIRCSRYFSKLFSSSINRQGVVTSFFTSTRAFFRLPYLVEMRAAPSVGTSGVTVLYAQGGATSTTTTFANTFPDKTSMSVEITGTFNITESGHVDSSGSGTLTVDAEL